MINLIEALNFRCLRYISQPLSSFHVLVGANASGKTTFLDVVSFLGQLVSGGPEAAVRERTQDFRDLVWNRQSAKFEVAIELAVPEEVQPKIEGGAFPFVRYEVALGQETNTQEISIFSERVVLKSRQKPKKIERTLFPLSIDPPRTILMPKSVPGAKTVVNKVFGGNDNYYPEVSPGGGRGGWVPSFKLGPRKSALANLPEDETRFPIATWLKTYLSDSVQNFMLNSLLIRRASPPGQAHLFKPDGSNLPWIIHGLERDSPTNLKDWISHVQTALPDLVGVRTIEREDDRHRYLMLQYAGGLEVPSWMASDGTLRLLALTLPAYLPEFSGVYLIEEPENGIHPRATETVVQSLSSVYDAQILLASHSPVILSTVETNCVLCFAKNADGAADIVGGDEHPALREWRGEENLGVLFAAGVLG